MLSSLLGAICSAIALIFTAVLNHRSPTTDTMQTWTCRWSNSSVSRGDGAPDSFNTLCNQTVSLYMLSTICWLTGSQRFAFYTTIPLFILQAILLTLAFLVMSGSRSKRHSTRLYDEPEKGVHELGDFRSVSFETKSEGSPKTANDRVKILGNRS